VIYECDKCQSALPPNKTQCPRCGEMFDEPVPPDAEAPVKGFSAKRSTPYVSNPSQGLDVKQLVGLIGAVVLFVGTFAPIVSVPVVGSINYFQNGKGDGSIIIFLAVLSAILVLTRRYTGLWITSALTLRLLAFTYLTLQARLSVAQESVGIELADNPFKEFGNVMLQSIQIQWGWALLVVGALLLVGAAALNSESKIAGNVSPQMNRTVAIMSGLLLAIIVGGSAAYAQHEKVQALDEVKAKVAKEVESKRQQDASDQQTAQAEDQAKQNALNQLTLETWTWDSTEYSRALVGTIQNNSNRTIGFVSVNFNLLDKDGDKVGTAEDMIETLNPGETWKFKASVFQDAAQRATLDSIKGRAEAGPAPVSPISSNPTPSTSTASDAPLSKTIDAFRSRLVLPRNDFFAKYVVVSEPGDDYGVLNLTMTPDYALLSQAKKGDAEYHLWHLWHHVSNQDSDTVNFNDSNNKAIGSMENGKFSEANQAKIMC